MGLHSDTEPCESVLPLETGQIDHLLAQAGPATFKKILMGQFHTLLSVSGSPW
jgi:hypothetical protein